MNMNQREPRKNIPDVRDGLTATERAVFHVLHETQRELGGRQVSTTMLYGRVLEHVDISESELIELLRRMAK